MAFVSYAQNFEDVILWRALKNISSGFYVDIGVDTSEKASVTKAFYEAGWSGVNLVLEKHLDEFLTKRERDINLIFSETDLSNQNYFFEECTEAFKQDSSHSPKYKTKEIHFLRIQADSQAIKTVLNLHLNQIRAWILIVSDSDCKNDWDTLILANQYEGVYFDGINKFYLAVEHGDLKNCFTTPPNSLDDFVQSSEVNLMQEVKTLQKTAYELKAQLKQNKRELQANKEELLFLYSTPSLQKRVAQIFKDILFFPVILAVILPYKLKQFFNRHPNVKNHIKTSLYTYPALIPLWVRFKNFLRTFFRNNPKLHFFLNKTCLMMLLKDATTKPSASLSNLRTRIMASLTVRLISYFNRHPKSKSLARTYISQHPWLYNFAQKVLASRYKNQLNQYASISPILNHKNYIKRTYKDLTSVQREGLENLSPYAQHIYIDLLAAIEAQKNKME